MEPNARNSVLNRTMIVSKSKPRRPGLPQVQSGPNSELASEQNENEPGLTLPLSARTTTITRNHHRKETITVDSSQKSFITEIRNAFDEIERMTSLSEREKLTEARNRIFHLVSDKEKEWMASTERYEKDKALKTQINELKIAVSNRTAVKAEAFYKMCEEYGIDMERVLKRDVNVIQKLGAMGTSSVAQSPMDQKEFLKLTQERDQLADEVGSLESNYSNLFKLYEKMRENCLQLKSADETLRNDLAEQSQKYNSLYNLYIELLNSANDKLLSADEELKRIEEENDKKSLGIRMTLKKAEIKVESLESALRVKIKENEELNKICNELLAKREVST
ncbi:transforming acidic coiled-coil-containing protein (TACC) domain-containing protein [Ditylenchus destructor]|uniref:Transforming acidic coiled-coil-containing protein (TACC) domain-containing protein n=1 Tax=Ditylenchus destructor TaxID=166010 RepID=A0AAD4NE86_9BILA|nr:transforming acidic coiled-coil-containing protein (TACC) domain-containing protein [Ditylenchus destructor]